MKNLKYPICEFIADNESTISYFAGNAIKHVTRHRKDGKKDIDKAIFYLEYAIEREIDSSAYIDQLELFCSQFKEREAKVIDLIARGQHEEAIAELKKFDYCIKDKR